MSLPSEQPLCRADSDGGGEAAGVSTEAVACVIKRALAEAQTRQTQQQATNSAEGSTASSAEGGDGAAAETERRRRLSLDEIQRELDTERRARLEERRQFEGELLRQKLETEEQRDVNERQSKQLLQ